MRRFVAQLLAAVFLATGTGAAEAAHRGRHEHGRQVALAAGRAAGLSVNPSARDVDAAGHVCVVCLALHAPLSLDAPAPPPVHFALSPFLRTIRLAQAPRLRTLFWIDCRGPPVA